MSNVPERATDARSIAKLIRGSYRLKYLVLLASVASSLIVSSTIRNGEIATSIVNRRSVEARLNWSQRMRTAGPSQGSEQKQATKLDATNPVMTDPSLAEMMDELESTLYSLILSTPADESKERKGSREEMTARYHEIQRIMAERENAYNVDATFSGIKTPITLNALTFIDWWPFIFLAVLALTIAISLRQLAQSIALTKIVQEITGDERTYITAATDFLSGRLELNKIGQTTCLIYHENLALSPDSFITSCLLIATAYFSFHLPAPQLPSPIMMDSSLLGMHTAILVWIGLLCICLGRTYRFYREQTREMLGKCVYTPLEFRTRHAVSRARDFLSRSRTRDLWVSGFGTLGICCIFLPWIGNWPLYGYEFFLPQHPLFQSSKILFYRVEPHLFNELRIQTIACVAFIVASLAWRAFRPRLDTRNFYAFSLFLSLIVAAIAANVLAFLGLLAYRQNRDVVKAVMDMILLNRTNIQSLEAPRGFPLIMQYPSYGFVIFACCVAALCMVRWANYAKFGR